MKIAIISPVYNEEKRIGDFLKSLSKIKLPVIFVDDGSNDTTSQKIKKSKNPEIKILTHEVNLGKGAALKTGCEYAFNQGYDAVIMMDSDGQHLASDLYHFENKLKEGYDAVLGSRNLSMGVPLDRFMGNKIASVIVALLFGIYVSDLICGFRAITKKAYKRIMWDSTGYGVEVETVIRIKSGKVKYCEVPVETVYYDSFKGVSILDAFGILSNLFVWKVKGI